MTMSESKRAGLVADLQPILMPGEKIQDVTTGVATVRTTGKSRAGRGTLFVTDRRVGVWPNKLARHQLLDFVFGRISLVDHRKGIFFGRITLVTASGQVDVWQIDRAEVERIAGKIRGNVALAHSHLTHPSLLG